MMLNKYLYSIFIFVISIITIHTEEVAIIELPVDLKVICEYSVTKQELVFMSNGNLSYYLPKDGKFEIKKYTSKNDQSKTFFQLNYSEEHLVWSEFDESLTIKVNFPEDNSPTSTDKIYLDLKITGDFKGKSVFGMIECVVILKQANARIGEKSSSK